jgi:hypothetical protein
VIKKLAVSAAIIAAIAGAVAVSTPAAASAAPTNATAGQVVVQDGELQGPWTTEGDCQRARALWGGRTSNCFRPGIFFGPWFFIGY